MYRISFWGLLCLTLITYLPVLGHYPVSDSWMFLKQRSLAETAEYFTRSVIPEEWNALWLRPLPMFTFWLDNVLLPDSYWWPHLVNILLHLANTALIWILVSMAVSRNGRQTLVLPPFAASLLYAVHPLTVGAVAWIAARFDVISVTFGLSAILMWFSWNAQPHRNSRLMWCLVLLTGSILSKEQGIVFCGALMLSACYVVYFDSARRRHMCIAVALMILVVAVCVAWRIALFDGLGGYLFRSGRPPNVANPFGFLAAFFFPYLNPAPEWHLNIVPVITSVIAIAVFMPLFRARHTHSVNPSMFSLIVFAGLLVLGLATTIPHSGFLFIEILEHIEARYALIGLTGFTLTAGWMLSLVSSIHAKRTITIILIIWAISALWRTDMQIAAWHSASETAEYIITTTLEEVPDPPRNSQLFFLYVPGYTAQHAYIFGTGLKEALQHAYRHRTDLIFNTRAVPDDLIWAHPDRDAVFVFNRKTWTLKLIDRLQR